MITILLMDKEVALDNHFQSALGRAGIRCVSHTDAKGGLLDLAYQPHRFSAVLAGDNLSLSIGEIVTRIQRAFAGQAAPPVIALVTPDKEATRTEVIEGLLLKDGEDARFEAINGGADRTLDKPLHIDLSVSMIHAVARRWGSPIPEVLRFSEGAVSLELDTGTRLAHLGDSSFDLTAKEYDLLEMFMRHPRQVLTRDSIYDQVWNYNFGGESNIIEVYVRYLRRKIEESGHPRLIHTVRGVGYVLRAA